MSCFPWLHFDFFGYVLRIPPAVFQQPQPLSKPELSCESLFAKIHLQVLVIVPPAGALRYDSSLSAFPENMILMKAITQGFSLSHLLSVPGPLS